MVGWENAIGLACWHGICASPTGQKKAVAPVVKQSALTNSANYRDQYASILQAILLRNKSTSFIRTVTLRKDIQGVVCRVCLNT